MDKINKIIIRQVGFGEYPSKYKWEVRVYEFKNNLPYVTAYGVPTKKEALKLKKELDVPSGDKNFN